MPLTEYPTSGETVTTHDFSAEAAQQRLDDNLTFYRGRALQGQDPDQVVQIPVRDVLESPTNPRRTYNEKAMAELSASIAAVGVMQSLLVRPVRLEIDPLVIGHYELVFGHRRFRGAQGAGLETVPCRVRELTDAECAQWQATENLQREDLTPLDEAQGYAAYIKAHGISKDALADKLGVSRTHVYNRLKLAELIPGAAQALMDGKIKGEVATLIARVPERYQAKALDIALEGYHYGEPTPFRKVRDELAEKFTLGLKSAIFDTAAVDLVPLAGACTSCPKRSGCTPELYQDLIDKDRLLQHWREGKGSTDICTDPDCFEAKKKAHLKAEAGKLEAAGAIVVQGGAARAAIGADGEVKGGYMSLKEWKADTAALKKAGKAPAIEIKPVTIQDPRTGKTVQAIKLADVKAAGVAVKERPMGGQSKWAEERKQEAARRAAGEAKAAVINAENLALLAQVHTTAQAAPRSAEDLRVIAWHAWDLMGWNRQGIVAKIYGFDDSKELDKVILQMPTDALGLFALTCALTKNLTVSFYDVTHPTRPAALLQAAEHYGVETPERWRPKEAKAVKQAAAAVAPLAATPIEHAAEAVDSAAQDATS